MKIDLDINESYKELSILIKSPQLGSDVLELMELKLKKFKSLLGEIIKEFIF